MKTILAIVFLSLLFVGCSTTGKPAVAAPGADQIVVTAEQVIADAFDLVNGFVTWEYENRKGPLVTPEITAIADTLRLQAPDKFRLARSLLASYKANRTAENAANLQAALAVIATLGQQAKDGKLKLKPSSLNFTPTWSGGLISVPLVLTNSYQLQVLN